MKLPDVKTFIIFLFAFSQFAYGKEAGNIRINGFFSSGVTLLDTDGVAYENGETDRPNFHTNAKLGLNLFGEITEDAEVIAQITMYPTTDSRAIFDWGFLAYHLTETFTIRTGKLKLPIWLVSDYIDIGYAYPWIRPPEEVYSLNPIKNFRGVSLEYGFPIGEFNFAFEPYAGSISANVLTYDSNAELEITPGSARNLLGASLKLESSWFLMRLAYMRTEVDFTGDVQGVTIAVKRQGRFYNLGVKAELHNFIAYTEYAKTESVRNQSKIREIEQNYIDVSTSGTASDEEVSDALTELIVAKGRYLGQTAYYLTLGYRYEQFLPHFTFASVDHPDEVFWAADQTSKAIGLKIILSEGLDLKIETKVISPKEGTIGLFSPKSALTNEAEIDDVIQYSVVFDALF